MRKSAWMRGLVLGCWAVAGLGTAWPASAILQKISGVRLVEQEGQDGDSFLVEGGGRQFRVRLYFVDAPETSTSWDSDLVRIREQRRYFGLSSEREVVEFGMKAAEFTREQLAEPFEVHTAFASALGRSPEGRVYGFVRTASGEDLGRLLVRNGLARAYGVGRESPEGVSRDEMKAQFADLEMAAMLRNAGLWESADPERIVELRAEQRRDGQALQNIRSGLREEREIVYPLDVNGCSREELQAIKGIGPALAEKITDGRPYQRMEDLLRIRGISQDKLETWRPYLAIPDGPGTN